MEHNAFILDNGLKVLLIQQPHILYARVTLTIKVGSLHDTIDGIAHLTEHMVFAGSQKYPKREELFDFIKQRGGWGNAYTEPNYTCYFYEVNAEYLEESLDIFAHCFIDPLLNPNDIVEEVKTIDSEFNIHVNDDRFVMSYLADEEIGHPPRLPSGSKATLGDKNLGNKLVEFFNTYYSADIMTLIILAPNISKLEKVIKKCFEAVKNVKPDIEIRNQQNTPKLIKFVPQSNDQYIMVCWNVPFFEYYQNPIPFLQYLVHTELHRDIGDFVVRYYFDISSEKNKVCLKMEVSDEGIKRSDVTIGFFYTYFKILMRKLDDLEELYQNFRQSRSFTNEIMKDAREVVERLGHISGYYDIPPDELIKVEYFLTPDFKIIKKNLKFVLNSLKPDNSVIVLASHYFRGLSKKHVYYQRKYSVDNTTIEPYITDYNFEIDNNPYFVRDNQIIDSDMETPQMLTNDSIKSYYYTNTQKYPTSDAIIITTIRYDNIVSVYEDMVVFVFVEYLKKRYEGWMSLVTNAGYEISMDYKLGCVKLCVMGNKQWLFSIFQTIIDKLANITKIDLEIFGRVKTNIKNIVKSFKTMDTVEKIKYYKTKLGCPYYYSFQDYKNISKLTGNNFYDVLQKTVVKDCSKQIKLFVSGNGCDGIFCQNCVDYLRDKLEGGKLFYQHKHKPYQTQIKEIDQQQVLYFKNPNKDCAVECLLTRLKLYCKNWIDEYLKIIILEHYLSTTFFDKIRTQLKLGYHVDVKLTYEKCNSDITCVLSMFVLSSSYSGEHILKKIEEFIKTVEFDEEKFDNIINSTKYYFKEMSTTPYLYTKFIFNSIIDPEYNSFELVGDILKAIESITFQDVLSYYNTLKHKKHTYLIVE